MRLIHAILICLLIISAMLIWLAFIPEVETARGVPHPDYPEMSLGGDGARSKAIFWPVFIWQAVAVIMGHLLILMSFPTGRHRAVLGWIGLSCIVNLGVWSALMWSYAVFLNTGKTAYIWGFPVASSLLIYGIWAGFLVLCGLYVFGFNRFVFTDEDEAKFHAILDRKAD